MNTSTPASGWIARDRWDALVRGKDCPLCVEVNGSGRDSSEGYFVLDLRVTRLRLQREQHVPGWCVLILRFHAREPHELPKAERVAFFEDMTCVGRALEQVYSALKINYSVLGNAVPHLHAHIQPRYYGDPYPRRAVGMSPDKALLLTQREAEDQIARIRAALA